MASILWVIGLGFVLGLQHATDPDHVVAAATIVSRERRVWSGAAVGVLWGAGHALTVGVAGGTIILLNLTVPATIALALEFAVALMLVGLGGFRLLSSLRGIAHIHPEHLAAEHAHGHEDTFHSHVHTHDGTTHRHPHIHPSPRLLAALGAVGMSQAVSAVAVGILHGLAGSAPIALLVLSTIRDPLWAVAYLGVFSAGTIIGMVAITALLTVPFAASAPRFARLNRTLSVGAALASVGLGVFLSYRIGFVGGLFSG